MIKVGLIGFGYWGEIYARLLSKNRSAKLEWICDINKNLLSQARKKFGIKTTPDYTDVLGDPQVQAVVVSTPLSTHYRIARDSLLNRKHVLVEKPFVRSTKEADSLIKLSEQKKLVLMVGHTFLFNDSFAKLKQIIKRRDLGSLRFITSNRTNLGPIREDANVIWDLAPHDLSMILELVGDTPYEVFTSAASYLRKDTPDVAFVTLRFEPNIIANITLSWLSPIKDRQFIVVGSKKMALFDDTKPAAKLTIYDHGVTIPPRGSTFEEFTGFFNIYQGKQTEVDLKLREPLDNKIRHFFTCIKKSSQPLADSLSGRRVISILEACERSLKVNRPVKFEG